MKQLISILLICLGFFSQAQEPLWLQKMHKDSTYTQSKYLSAFLSAKKENKQTISDLSEMLKMRARDQMLTSFKSKISVESKSEVSEINNTVYSQYKYITKIESQADIIGLQYETYYSKKEKTVYVFAYAAKSEMIKYYSNKIDEKIKTVEQNFIKMQIHSENTSYQKALLLILQNDTLISSIFELQETLLPLNTKIFKSFNEKSRNIIRLNFEKRNKILSLLFNAITIGAVESEYILKKGDLPFCFDANVKQNYKPAINIPLKLKTDDNQDVEINVRTNEKGTAEFCLKNIMPSQGFKIYTVSLNLFDYLSLPYTHPLYKEISTNYQLQEFKLFVRMIPPKIFIETNELVRGQKLDVLVIEPEVKACLANKGYTFSDIENDSEIKITIAANARYGSSFHDMHSAFVDANISIKINKTGEEIFKASYISIKGVSFDKEQALKIAYTKAAQKISDAMNNRF
jgi:hypothetical protein